jgi:hypothetical protein
LDGLLAYLRFRAGRIWAGWPYAACYHEYDNEPLRGQLLAITQRTVEPRCGEIDFDVPGRIEPARIRVERVMDVTADEVDGFSENAREYLR